MLVDLDGTKPVPGRTPLFHSPVAAAFWSLLGCAFVFAFGPVYLAGTVLAFVVGFGSHLAIDSFCEGGIFLWPRTLTPSEWLMPYRPESLVELEGRPFAVPSESGAVPQPWSGWRSLVLGPGGSDQRNRYRSIERLRPHAGPLLSAASLAALLAAVSLA